MSKKEKTNALKSDEEIVVKESRYYIADGKALTSKRGILDAGNEVKVEYLPGGEETLNKFVKSGHIVKG